MSRLVLGTASKAMASRHLKKTGQRLAACAVLIATMTACQDVPTSPAPALAPRNAASPKGITATDLGTLGGDYSVAYAINSKGQVAGYSYTLGNSTHAFIWDKGAMTDLGTLGGSSIAVDLNSFGQAVGYSYTADGSTAHAFLW